MYTTTTSIWLVGPIVLSPNWKDGRIDTIPKLKEGDGVEIGKRVFFWPSHDTIALLAESRKKPFLAL